MEVARCGKQEVDLVGEVHGCKVARRYSSTGARYPVIRAGPMSGKRLSAKWWVTEQGSVAIAWRALGTGSCSGYHWCGRILAGGVAGQVSDTSTDVGSTRNRGCKPGVGWWCKSMESGAAECVKGWSCRSVVAWAGVDPWMCSPEQAADGAAGGAWCGSVAWVIWI